MFEKKQVYFSSTLFVITRFPCSTPEEDI
jgi:hypothetical protein